MAEKDNALLDKLSDKEATEVLVDDEADSLLQDGNCSRRDSNDLVSVDERRQSEDSFTKDISSVDLRTESVSDQILGEMGSFLEDSPNHDDEEVTHKQEDDHEDILDVQAGVDATIDDQFEVLDSAGETDHVEDTGKTTAEDDKRRSKTKHSTNREELPNDKKEPREAKEKEPDDKGFVLYYFYLMPILEI